MGYFQFVRPDTNIDFIGKRKICYILSCVIISIGIISLIAKGGPRYGIDFVGGITMQVKFDKTADLNVLSSALEKTGLPGVTVQSFGKDTDNSYLIRTSAAEVTPDKAGKAVQDALKTGLPGINFEIQKMEMVGPKVGEDLRSKALQAIFYSLLLISIYISGRFEQRWLTAGIMAAALAGGIYVLELLHVPMSFLILAALIITLGLCVYLKLHYALGAIVALLHDVMIPVGIFSLLGKEFDLTIVAALLTIIGYSLNDTIIIYDRIRENLRDKTAPTFDRIINISVNQTLSRTLLTSGTALVAILCLYFLGGNVIHDFSLALLIGIVVGTYSSIYVASSIMLTLVTIGKAEEKTA